MVFAKWKPREARPAIAPPEPLPAARWGAALALACVLFFFRGPLRSAFFILDGIDLVIHEAGHPILGLFGWHWLMMAGGTIFQLAWPAAFVVHFQRHGQPKSAWACVGWVGQNFLHIGRYAADARAQELPLVGGGVHDWTYLLDCWGLLRHDIGVGMFFDFLGCALIAWAIVEIVAALRKPDPALI